MGGANPCERCVNAGQDYLAHHSRWVINNFLFHSQSLVCTGCITLKQQCVPHTNTNILAMISTYGGVLSGIEKALQELMEEYRGVRRSLWDLVEGQERNTAQLKRIEVIMEWRWGLEEENGKEESRDEEGVLRITPEKVRRKRLCCPSPVRSNSLANTIV